MTDHHPLDPGLQIEPKQNAGAFPVFLSRLSFECEYSTKSSKEKTPVTGVLVLLVRGAARSRTAVQTGNPYAFYMLSPSLVVGKEPAMGYELNP